MISTAAGNLFCLNKGFLSNKGQILLPYFLKIQSYAFIMSYCKTADVRLWTITGSRWWMTPRTRSVCSLFISCPLSGDKGGEITCWIMSEQRSKKIARRKKRTNAEKDKKEYGPNTMAIVSNCGARNHNTMEHFHRLFTREVHKKWCQQLYSKTAKKLKS